MASVLVFDFIIATDLLGLGLFFLRQYYEYDVLRKRGYWRGVNNSEWNLLSSYTPQDPENLVCKFPRIAIS